MFSSHAVLDTRLNYGGLIPAFAALQAPSQVPLKDQLFGGLQLFQREKHLCRRDIFTINIVIGLAVQRVFAPGHFEELVDPANMPIALTRIGRGLLT